MNRIADGSETVDSGHAPGHGYQCVLVERRSGRDRRQPDRRSIRHFLIGGRRTWGRRSEDRQRLQYFDRYHHSHFSLIVLILFFSVLDALLTLHLIGHGAIEVNPIMAFYLGIGPYTFLFVKYGLTSVGLILLLLINNFVMQSIRVRAGTLFYLVLATFVGVVSWQIYLIHRVVV
jgi:hypothetical protein